MKIRLDDVMQSFSFPFEAVYYYYIPLETVLMFAGGMIYGKAVHGISSEEDVKKNAKDFIKLPQIGDEGRRWVMISFMNTIENEEVRAKLEKAIEEGIMYFGSALREEKLLLPWYNYRDEIYKELAVRWSKENGLELFGQD